MKRILFLMMLTGILNGADVEVVKAGVPPVIDGRTDDRAHFAATAAKSLCAGFFAGSFTALAAYQPLVMLSYDSENLYVGYWCPLPPDAKAAGNKKFSWHDDLVQVIIGKYSFAVNASGVSDPAGIRSAACAGNGYWTAEMAIPWKAAGLDAVKEGDHLPVRVMAYQTAVRDWLHWLPLVQSPSRPGAMLLGKDFPVAYHPRNPREDEF